VGFNHDHHQQQQDNSVTLFIKPQKPELKSWREKLVIFFYISFSFQLTFPFLKRVQLRNKITAFISHPVHHLFEDIVGRKVVGA